MTAKRVPFTYRDYVRRGFEAAEYLGLEPVLQAAAMGEKVPFRRSVQGLRRRLGREMSDEHRIRSDCLVVVVSALKGMYKTKADIRAWVDAPNDAFGGKTPKAMLTGNLPDMERVVAHVKSIVAGK